MRRTILMAVLALTACGSSVLGDACKSKSDCPADMECVATLPGGYCTLPCKVVGDLCESGACTNFAGSLFCGKTCYLDSHTYCRDGYRCVPVTFGSLDRTTCVPSS